MNSLKVILGLLISAFPVDMSFIDVRDGNSYTELDMNQSVWLKENLRYLFKTVNQDDSLSYQDPNYYDRHGSYYNFKSAKYACPSGYHLPSLQEWKNLINEIPGKKNSRQGKLVAKTQLVKYGLQLGGIGQKDTILLAEIMGYYWTSTDTLKAYYKEPDKGNQRHLVGIHIWESGENDSIIVEPTYMLAKTYEPAIFLSCKCVKDPAEKLIPRGKSIMLDREVGLNEWSDAKQIKMDNSVHYYIKQTNTEVLIGIDFLKSDTSVYRWVELFIGQEKRITRLHASGQLGEQIFDGNAWHEEWTWGNNKSWKATIQPGMNPKPNRIFEFKIDKNIFNDVHIATYIEAYQAVKSEGFDAQPSIIKHPINSNNLSFDNWKEWKLKL